MVKKKPASGKIKKSKNQTLRLFLIAILIAVIVFSLWYYTTLEKEDTGINFTLVDLEGNTFSLSDYRGKVVILDFMALWCGPCRIQIPQLGAVWEIYKDEIVIISIDVDPFETTKMLKDFRNQYPYATWIWAKDTANLNYEYKIAILPTSIIVDQEGNLASRYKGVTSSSILQEDIERLLD